MLDEKPEDLIQSSIDSFEIEPDILTLNRIEDTINKISQERSHKISFLQEGIKKLENELKSLQEELELLGLSNGLKETLNSLGDSKLSNEEEHENIFNIMNKKSIEIDNLKLSLAKKLNDLESHLNSLNITKNNLTNKQEELISENEKLIDKNLLNNFDSKIMKINLFKNLGISIENANLNENDKIVIYNKLSDLTSILTVDDKYSDYFITNYIWERLPGL